MTRINTVHPEHLTNKALGAEYRELPRILSLVRKAVERGETPEDKRNPSHYTLGPGHCRFFYPRLNYLVERYSAIVSECCRRGRKVSYPSLDTSGIPSMWFGEWWPGREDVRTNIKRLVARRGLILERDNRYEH